MSRKNPLINLTKAEINELKARLLNIGLDLAAIQNRRTGDEAPINARIDDLLAEILSKAEMGTAVITKPEPLYEGVEEPKPRRVVITGMGTVNPLGYSLNEYWDNLRNGRSGITRMTLCDPSNYPTQVAGEVKEWVPKNFLDVKEARRMSRASQLVVTAALMAVKDANLNIQGDIVEEYGVLIGTGNAAFPEVEEGMRTLMAKGGMRLSPFFLPIILPNMPASQVSMVLGTKGYNGTVISACASSTQAIGEAAEVIRRGDAEVMISGGTEAPISELGLASFSVMRAMSSHFNDRPTTASRPFDQNRDGFVPSEGAGVLILESLEHALARNARIYAELGGYAATSDSHHITNPDPDGMGAVRAMRRAIHKAGLTPRDVDYINAHATSTDLGDVAETVAIKKVFGDYAYQIPISSTKSMIGHLLGGSGGVEAIATILMMQNEMIHPTINLDNPDPECDLDYVPHRARPYKIKVALSNSFGFGGQNACIIIKEYKPEPI
jgi:3-oxoacyl-[acyl-carrier-protein] synthase II